MKRQEFILNCLLILGSLVAIFLIIPAWSPEGQGYGLSASTLPSFACAAIAVLALMQIFTGLKRGIKRGDPPISAEVVKHLVKYFGVMLLIFPAWKFLGFLAGSAFVLALLYVLAGNRSWKIVTAISVLLPLVSYGLLVYGLHVPTP